MIDLTNFFLQAYSFKVQLEKLPEILRFFAETGDFSIDWDFDDGELWGRIFNVNETVGMFHATLPIVFADILYYRSIDKFLRQQDFQYTIVEVDDWDSKKYSIKLPSLENILNWHSSLPSDSFSINDLWFATI